MPDLESLLSNVQNAIKESNIKEEDLASEEFNLSTFYTQLKAMGKMGPMKGVLGSLGMSDLPKGAAEEGERKLVKYKTIIDSMTPEEGKIPGCSQTPKEFPG